MSINYRGVEIPVRGAWRDATGACSMHKVGSDSEVEASSGAPLPSASCGRWFRFCLEIESLPSWLEPKGGLRSNLPVLILVDNPVMKTRWWEISRGTQPFQDPEYPKDTAGA